MFLRHTQGEQTCWNQHHRSTAEAFKQHPSLLRIGPSSRNSSALRMGSQTAASMSACTWHWDGNVHPKLGPTFPPLSRPLSEHRHLPISHPWLPKDIGFAVIVFNPHSNLQNLELSNWLFLEVSTHSILKNPKLRDRGEAFAPRGGLHLAECLREIRSLDGQKLHLLCAVGLRLLRLRACRQCPFLMGTIWHPIWL